MFVGDYLVPVLVLFLLLLGWAFFFKQVGKIIWILRIPIIISLILWVFFLIYNSIRG